jgi:secreted PhoX family phosphatase
MRFDPQGNLYSISESNPGYIYRFVPDQRNDLSSGQLYALRVTRPTRDRTGEAEWMPLDRASVQVDANAAAAAVGATGYNRPEDVEMATSTGNNHGGANTLYVSVTAPPSDSRVLGIDLREPAGGNQHDTAFVYDYVRPGVNAPEDFEWPDNLALDRAGNLYIAEDPPESTIARTGRGDDVWVATPPNQRGQHPPAESVVRFASLTDCDAEPTGIYFKMTGSNIDNGSGTLFANVQHRGGDGRDLAVAITEADSSSAGKQSTTPAETAGSTTPSAKNR